MRSTARSLPYASLAAALSLGAFALPPAAAQQGSGVVYRCPGNPVLYTDALTPQEAQQKGCKVLEGAPVTVIQSPQRPRPPAAGVAPASTSPAGARIDPNEQRARDSDARRILETELRKEEDRLIALQREYNGGEPERRGDERNYQRYLDRVQELKAGIARKEADIAALRRELAKLPPS
jgi:hypothetical protein